MSVPTFAQAARHMLAEMRASNTPVKAATFRATESKLRAINRALGDKPLSDITGSIVKAYVAARVSEGLSGSTVNGEYLVIKKVVESIVDENLNCVYPIRWAVGKLDLPSAKPSEDRRPCTAPRAIEKAVRAGLNPYSQLVAFLGFTGMRIGEGVACRIGTANPDVTHWDANESLIRVRTAIDVGDEHTAKTELSANHTVDLCTAANDYLRAYAGDRQDGFLFTVDGTALERNRLYRAAAKLCGPYHGLRRARVTHLYRYAVTPAQLLLAKFWLGHDSEQSQTDRYSAIVKDAEFRREFAEKVGIGFRLPDFAAPERQEAVEALSA